MRGSREISLVPSLHRASTDALIVHPFTPLLSGLAFSLYSSKDHSRYPRTCTSDSGIAKTGWLNQ